MRLLAKAANRRLTEIALTAGSDTSDILGGFEQLEPKRRIQVRFFGGAIKLVVLTI